MVQSEVVSSKRKGALINPPVQESEFVSFSWISCYPKWPKSFGYAFGQSVVVLPLKNIFYCLNCVTISHSGYKDGYYLTTDSAAIVALLPALLPLYLSFFHSTSNSRALTPLHTRPHFKAKIELVLMMFFSTPIFALHSFQTLQSSCNNNDLRVPTLH